jgi:hypothetical protein
MSTKHASRLGLAGLAGMVLIAASGSAMAQGVGNLGQLPVPIPIDSTNTWVVSDPASGGPVPVVLNPAGPVWHKDLLAPPGALIQGGVTYHLQESLVVAGNLPWADYHENILTPGWSWSNPSFLVNNAIPAGLSVNNTGSSISFNFNPIGPGSLVKISKDLVYSGPVPATFQSIGVNQFPTPEPASLGLLAVGSLLALRRRGLGAR